MQQPPSLDVFRFAHVIEESSVTNNSNNNTNNGKSKSTNNRSKFPPNTFRSYDGETSYSYLEQILAQEKQNNKAESWNKLEKNMKIQKLHAFAERFGKEHGFPVKEIRSSQIFFCRCLGKGQIASHQRCHVQQRNPRNCLDPVVVFSRRYAGIHSPQFGQQTRLHVEIVDS